MSDILPLIPEKDGVCSDVRRVLHQVFPPRPPLPGARTDCPPARRPWMQRHEAACKDLHEHEEELKLQRAKRLSRHPLPNIYKLHIPSNTNPNPPDWTKEYNILDRRDLLPTLIQNSNAEETLWVKNILAKSSGDLTADRREELAKLTKKLRPTALNDTSKPYRLPAPPPSRFLPPSVPDHIVCVPPALKFVDFTVGSLHTQSIRVVNTSRREVRLSLRPPRTALLLLELCAGLTVTAGASITIKVHFRPRDVRVVRDELTVRTCTGQCVRIPVECYMRPPVLEIMVPALSPCSLWCSAEELSSQHSSCLGAGEPSSLVDCLELGARLLGDVHYAPLLLRCDLRADFFLLTEDAWLSFNIDVVTAAGSLVEEPFVISPVWLRGGGTARGAAWCRAPAAGLHCAALRVLASTAVHRPLNLIADALYFRPEHITIQAQERDCDICSEQDPASQYYVQLGSAPPARALAASVFILNHSPIVYSYYWSVRSWAICSCWRGSKTLREENRQGTQEESEQNYEEGDSSGNLCAGAVEDRDRERLSSDASAVRVQCARGVLAARASCAAQVCVPRAAGPGAHRAVLMLMLKDIPRESITAEYENLIVRTDVVDSEPVPGIKPWKRVVCEVVCAQLEVWWKVQQEGLYVDPPALHLEHSRRVSSIDLTLRAVPLLGSAEVSTRWSPAPLAAPALTVHYALPVSTAGTLATDVINVDSPDGEHRASCVVWCRTSQRRPRLSPASRWLGVVPPGAPLRAALQLSNDTYQDIQWKAHPLRWYRENPPHAACDTLAPTAADKRGSGTDPGTQRNWIEEVEGNLQEDAERCEECCQPACTCNMLQPCSGTLPHGATADIVYSTTAPMSEGCVMTLITVYSRAESEAEEDRSVSLVAYRVLAPRLSLRVLACGEPEAVDSRGAGAAALRPQSALVVGSSTSYTLRVTNLTPVPALVTWEPALVKSAIAATFSPNECKVGAHQRVDVQVSLQALEVCPRRVCVLRAHVTHTRTPLYLLVDAAVVGAEILVEVPLSGALDSTVLIPRSQVSPRDARKLPQSFAEIFAAEDSKKTVLTFYKDVPEGPCLQFHNVPLRTVCSRVVVLHNPSARPAEWSAALRRYARTHRRTINTDQWADDVCSSGVVLDCRVLRVVPEPGEVPTVDLVPTEIVVPKATVMSKEKKVPKASAMPKGKKVSKASALPKSSLEPEEDILLQGSLAPTRTVPAVGGVLPAGGRCELAVQAYADTWGLYRDQLAIQFYGMRAVVLDIWLQVDGCALRPVPGDCTAPLTLWMGVRDAERSVRVRNESRAPLAVHAYTTRENVDEILPFRLYYRLVDACPGPPASEEAVDGAPAAVELYLGPDCGPQTHAYYQVWPESQCVPPFECGTWLVRGPAPCSCEAPPCSLLLRPVPIHKSGEWWWRAEPAALRVRLRRAGGGACADPAHSARARTALQ